MNAMFKVVCFSILFCKIDSILIVYCGEKNVRFDGYGEEDSEEEEWN